MNSKKSENYKGVFQAGHRTRLISKAVERKTKLRQVIEERYVRTDPTAQRATAYQHQYESRQDSYGPRKQANAVYLSVWGSEGGKTRVTL